MVLVCVIKCCLVKLGNDFMRFYSKFYKLKAQKIISEFYEHLK